MRNIFLLSLCMLVSSCATPLILGAQHNCHKDNDSQLESSKRDCGNMNDVIHAISMDTNNAKEVGQLVKEKYTREEKDAPLHEGADSNLCNTDESKVCTFSSGCWCSSSGP